METERAYEGIVRDFHFFLQERDCWSVSSNLTGHVSQLPLQVAYAYN